MVPEVFIDPHATQVEGVSISAENAGKEHSHSDRALEVSFDPGCPSPVQVLAIVLDFLLFLAIGYDHSDSVQSLVGITSTLTVGLHRLLGPLG